MTDSAWLAVAWAIGVEDLKLSKHVGEDRIRRVLIVLALHVNQEFESAVGREMIAKLTGLPERVVSEALDALDGSELVERVQKSRPIRRRLCVRQSLTDSPEPFVRQSRTDWAHEVSGLSSGLSSGRALREGEVEDPTRGSLTPDVPDRGREPEGADLALAVLAEAGLPAEHRARLLDISKSTSTHGAPTDFPAGRLSDPIHRAAVLRQLRSEIRAAEPQCPICGNTIEHHHRLNNRLAVEDRCPG